jgi:hypothetical protein
MTNMWTKRNTSLRTITHVDNKLPETNERGDNGGYGRYDRWGWYGV